MRQKGKSGWAMHEEVAVIKYMASGEDHVSRPAVTVADRKFRLKTWIETSFTRKFDSGVNVEKCRQLAKDLLARL